MNAQPRFFAPLARVLHWLMALMIIAMLFIGAGLAASVSERHEWLIHLHKPLGIAILALVIVRLDERFELVPRLAADRIRERDPALVVLDHGQPGEAAADAATSEDDAYYARFQVPDDLVW